MDPTPLLSFVLYRRNFYRLLSDSESSSVSACGHAHEAEIKKTLWLECQVQSGIWQSGIQTNNGIGLQRGNQQHLLCAGESCLISTNGNSPSSQESQTGAFHCSKREQPQVGKCPFNCWYNFQLQSYGDIKIILPQNVTAAAPRPPSANLNDYNSFSNLPQRGLKQNIQISQIIYFLCKNCK